MNKKYLLVKKIIDLVFALLLLTVSMPVLLLTALAIKIESKGPVLFKQSRPGKNEEIFTVYKFRTMKVETEFNGKKHKDFDRMTRIGGILRKTSIDELPQLLNIMKGEMSFIGPRPLLVEYLKCYNEEQQKRHDVLPGITGWAQVNGRNAISWEEKFKLDVWYVHHINFRLDIKIVIMTIVKIIKRSGINNSNSNTMPTFHGSYE